MIFGLIGVNKSLVWPSSSEIAVIFIGHVFKTSATHSFSFFFYNFCSILIYADTLVPFVSTFMLASEQAFWLGIRRKERPGAKRVERNWGEQKRERPPPSSSLPSFTSVRFAR